MFKDSADQADRRQATPRVARQGKAAIAAAQRAPEAPLENIANNSSPFVPDSRPDKRKERFSARYWLWDFSTLSRVRNCGRRTHTETGSVAVRLSEGRAGYAGVQTCGSVWVDPVCNAKIMARRALEIGAAVETWQGLGHGVAMMTFTLRHHKRQRLGGLWDVVSKAWASVTSGKGWVSDKGLGVEGFLRVTEVNVGLNGWHVHIHALIFLDGSFSAGNLEKLHASMTRRWVSAAKRLGLAAPLVVGQDCKLITSAADKELGQYLAKAVHGGHAVGLEFTHSQSKRARRDHSTVSVWTLLDNARDGIDEAVQLWQEFERVSKGKRQISWSQGLRKRLQLAAEKTDEEIAGEELGSCDDDLVIITRDGWASLVRQRLLVECLAAAEAGGLAGLRDWLAVHGIDFERV